MPETKNTTKIKKTDEPMKFKGKFISAIGKRKTATAQVRLYKNGKGIVIINDVKMNQYFAQSHSSIIHQALKLTGHLRDLDFSVRVNGGGKGAQAQAVVLGIARGLVKLDEALRPTIKAKGWLTRDARKKERKKPGLKKARKAPQWSKR